MVLAAFKPVESRVRDAGLLGEFGERKVASFLPQKRRQLLFQMSPHVASMAERS